MPARDTAPRNCARHCFWSCRNSLSATSTELDEQFDRTQKSYAPLEQSAFHVFNAQATLITHPWPWQGVSDDCKDEREFEDCLMQANWCFVHKFNRFDIALTHMRNCWAIRKPRPGDVFGANCRLAIINPGTRDQPSACSATMTHPGEVIVDEDFRCSSQFGPLGDAGILGRLPERWREIIPPSISLSRAVLMISQKIGLGSRPRG